MGFLDSLDLSSSGMTAERLRMDVISNNLANANTTHSPDGQPYKREEVILEQANTSFDSTLGLIQAGADGEQIANSMDEGGTSSLGGVKVAGIVPDQTPFKEEYDPGNPDADKRGYVKLPNISVVSEMVDMMGASRAYEANVTAIQSAKSMAERALDIGKA
jgi:flagellar basal-body rod protein FlgC